MTSVSIRPGLVGVILPDEPADGPELDVPWECGMLAGRHVRLRTIGPQDYLMLFQIETGDFVGRRWRQRGATPSFEAFVGRLFEGVLCQYLATAVDTAEPIGCVTLYDANLASGHAFFAATKFAESDRTTRILEASALLIDRAFHQWSLRKLYVSIPEYNLHQLSSGLAHLLVEEGRLRGHELLAGRYWDLVTAAIYRSAWYDRRDEFASVLGLHPYARVAVNQ